MFDQETQRGGEVRRAVSCYIVNHVGRRGSCFAETGWSEQKLETQREIGSRDVALLRRAVHSLVVSLVKWAAPRSGGH